MNNKAQDYIKEHNIKSYNDMPYMTVNPSLRLGIWKELGEFCYTHDTLWGKEYVACPAGHKSEGLCSRKSFKEVGDKFFEDMKELTGIDVKSVPQANSDLVKAGMTKEEQDEATSDMEHIYID